jgi:hypothetical protein
MDFHDLARHVNVMQHIAGATCATVATPIRAAS